MVAGVVVFVSSAAKATVKISAFHLPSGKGGTRRYPSFRIPEKGKTQRLAALIAEPIASVAPAAFTSKAAAVLTLSPAPLPRVSRPPAVPNRVSGAKSRPASG